MPGGVIYLTVDFTAAAGTQTSATLERGLSAVGPWGFLRDVALLGEMGSTYDTTVPLDTPVWYRWTSDLGDIVIQGPFTELSNGNVFLKDPVRPWANIELEFCTEGPRGARAALCGQAGPEFVWVAHGTKVRRANAGLFDRLDAQTPADVYARRKRLDGEMTLFSKTLAGMDAVDALFDAGGPLQLQMPPVYGWRDAFVQPSDLAEDYIGRNQSLPFRQWTAPFTVVDSSAAVGPIQGTECANWCTVEETWPTFADMTAAGGTWAEIASGETQCPDGEPVEAMTDTFTRTVVDGWGTMDTGQTWTITQGTAANFSVSGGTGKHSHNPFGLFHTTIAPFSSADVSMRADFALDQVPSGDNAFVFYTARVASTQTFYTARVQIASGGAMTLSVRKRIAGVETQLGTFATGLTYVAGVVYRLRFAVQGDDLMAKVWLASGSEPAGWQTTASDTDLTAAGSVGIRTLTGGGLANTPPLVMSFDNLVVTP